MFWDIIIYNEGICKIINLAENYRFHLEKSTVYKNCE